MNTIRTFFSRLIFAGTLSTPTLLCAMNNSYYPVQPAFASGTLGLRVGLQSTRSTEAPVQNNQYQLLAPEDSLRELYTVSFNKGTPWPIDIGGTYSQLTGTHQTKAGMHIQYTFFQRFRLPALAFRIHAVRSFGSENYEGRGLGASLIADYSFLRYFTLLIETGIQRDTAIFNFKNGKEELVERQNLIHQGYGLFVNLWPGVLRLGYQRIVDSSRSEDIALLSFGS